MGWRPSQPTAASPTQNDTGQKVTCLYCSVYTWPSSGPGSRGVLLEGSLGSLCGWHQLRLQVKRDCVSSSTGLPVDRCPGGKRVTWSQQLVGPSCSRPRGGPTCLEVLGREQAPHLLEPFARKRLQASSPLGRVLGRLLPLILEEPASLQSVTGCLGPAGRWECWDPSWWPPPPGPRRATPALTLAELGAGDPSWPPGWPESA